MQSRYMRILEALRHMRCEECHGLGECSDAEPGDTYCKTWTCPACKGTGFKNGEIGDMPCPDNCEFKGVTHKHVEGVVS